ncbi:Holliday junction branch migration protein RuvA [Catenovulum sp. SM1970]|uniref:Holliday junction branch migration protein RuvA n=1 Tax=Marinifaba aquimaris TaxID=2741323 RepID=UPI0015739C63|nr:Holliday junction branch migration protein RuvA [Marinifaba aquimaris]
MIVRLTGTIIEKTPPQCVIDVNGVGYEVNLPMTSFYQLPNGEAPGEETKVTLFIHPIYREDTQALYGFNDKFERDLFKELLKANGVGPKLALAILSALSADEFISAINQGDVSRIVKVPGVGKKTAERLVLEMTDRLKAWSERVPVTVMTSKQGEMQMSAPEALEQTTSPTNDAIDALIALGYKANQAEAAVKKVAQAGMSSEALIKDALKSMI